jgi:NADH-quinone oxidoreductase subunit E
LGLKDGKFTTPDMMFTVETVACLGACGVAPAMVINEKVYGKMTPEAACTIIDTLLYRDGDN